MANRKISELPAGEVPLQGEELVEIVQGGENRQVPASAFGGGAHPMLIFTLPESIGDFASNEFTSWDSATVVQESEDAHWSDDNHAIVFDTAGVYQITVRGRADGNFGWPSDEIVLYGIKIDGSTIGQHARYESTGEGAGFASEFVQWTDTTIVSATAEMELVLGIFAKAYTAGSSVSFRATVTVQRVSP